MSFFSKLSTGWEISKTSYQVLKANTQLLIFPILSGISIVFILGSFVLGMVASEGWSINAAIASQGREMVYFWCFLFYVVNYFVVVFFNIALIHCTRLYFDGETPTVSQGIRFSMSRLGKIFTWAVFAATIGLILKIIQDNFGWIGKIVTGLLGFVWGMATFFVVPVLAYEEVGPIDAVKRSGTLMKEKWGESLGANFSFGLMQMAGVILLLIVSLILAGIIHPIAGGIVFGVGFVTLMAVSSALNSIFVAAVYNNTQGKLNIHFNQELFDGLFEEKGKRKLF